MVLIIMVWYGTFSSKLQNQKIWPNHILLGHRLHFVTDAFSGGGGGERGAAPIKNLREMAAHAIQYINSLCQKYNVSQN